MLSENIKEYILKSEKEKGWERKKKWKKWGEIGVGREKNSEKGNVMMLEKGRGEEEESLSGPWGGGGQNELSGMEGKKDRVEVEK